MMKLIENGFYSGFGFSIHIFDGNAIISKGDESLMVEPYKDIEGYMGQIVAHGALKNLPLSYIAKRLSEFRFKKYGFNRFPITSILKLYACNEEEALAQVSRFFDNENVNFWFSSFSDKGFIPVVDSENIDLVKNIFEHCTQTDEKFYEAYESLNHSVHYDFQNVYDGSEQSELAKRYCHYMSQVCNNKADLTLDAFNNPKSDKTFFVGVSI